MKTVQGLAAVLLTAFAGAAGAQLCEPVWDASYGPDELRILLAVTPFDPDGPGPVGPSLHVGGTFEAFSGRSHPNFIARLEGRQWEEVGGGVDAAVNALAVFDEDGAGPQPPALFASGAFTHAAGEPAERIARWNGAQWSQVGDGLQGSVSTLLVAEIGGAEALYAAGEITGAGGVAARGIARWDGSEWSAMGEGLEGRVQALVVHDDGAGPALYAGGARPVPMSSATEPFVARWTGAEWALLSGNFSHGAVRALASFDPDGAGPRRAELIAGGTFETIDGVRVRNVARFDDAGWHPMEGGLGSTGLDVYTMSTFDEDGAGPLPPRLFIAGDFNVAHLASGSSRSDIQRLVRWDGETWSPVGHPLHSDRIWDMCVCDPDGPGPEPEQLVLVGTISFAGTSTDHTIAGWDGVRWRFPSGGFDDSVLALASGAVGAAPPDYVYAGGRFGVAGGGFAQRLARLDEDGWTPLDQAPDDVVHAIHAADADGPGPLPPSLFIGGEFLKVGFVNAPRIARWDGQYWWPLGVGADGIVHAFATFDEDGAGPGNPSLFVGGEFSSIGDAVTQGLARWDGAGFHPMPEPLVSTLRAPKVYAALVHDDGRGEALFIAGHFTGAGEIESRGVIRWDGAEWSALDKGVGLAGSNDAVRALAVFDDGRGPALYAAGVFATAGGEQVNNIARWDGAAWEPVGGGLVRLMFNTHVTSLAATELAGRPALLAGGIFDQAGGSPARNLALWNGAAWSGLDVDRAVTALLAAPVGEGVFVAGEFEQTGEVASQRLARLLTCESVCYADCDRSGELDVFDFLCYQNAYAAQDPYADCDASGELDFFDFLCFQNDFSAGCP